MPRPTTTEPCCTRRAFLHGLGAAIALPWFPSLAPRSAWRSDPVTPPVRLMFLCVPLGFVPNQSLFACPDFAAAGSTGWLPEADGPLARLPEVHAALEPFRAHLSFVKGLCNQRYRGEVHSGDNAFLTCADTLADPAKAFSNTISCDQVAAMSAALGGDGVRHRSLSLGVRYHHGSRTGGLSWGAGGAPISPLISPATVFDRLFGKDDVPAEVRLARLAQKRSVLDATLGQLRDLERSLSRADRERLDEAVTAVRGVEAEIQREERWIALAKPAAPFARPDAAIASTSRAHARAMLDLAHAAFLTDSTRVIAYWMPPSFSEVSPIDKHQLNHDLPPTGARDAIAVDRAMSDELAAFAGKLCASRDHDGRTLMHHALVAYGAASWGPNHLLRNLPMLLLGHGGGRIRQGFSRRCPDPTPLANLWLTMLTAAGAVPPGGAFADSTGTLPDLLQP